MARAGVAELEARLIPLSANDRLIVDRREGLYRVAFYRLRRPQDRPAGTPSPETFDQAVARGYLPQGKREAWRRAAVEREELRDALYVVFDDPLCRHDWGTVEAYIRATPWGSEWP